MQTALDFLADHAQPIVAAGLLAVGVFAGAWTLRARRLVRASQSWPSVVGTVVRSRPSYLTLGGNDARGEAKHTLVVEYTYAVAGRAYTGDIATFGPERAASHEEIAADAARRFPPGAQVQVFYDPRDPSTAALERGTQESFLGPLALSAGSILASGWVWWRGIP